MTDMSGVYRSGSAVGRATRALYWGVGLELLVWVSAFIYLGIFDPYTKSEFTFCLFSRLGFHYCPGCGLGRAVSFLLHGDLQRSLQTHILAIPATIILLYRVISLLKQLVDRKSILSSVH